MSDVHANLPALLSVLEGMSSVDVLLHAGDIVGYYPYPNKVIERFRELGVISIMGNHDRAVISGEYQFPAIASTVIKWTIKRLQESNFEYLRSLPVMRSIEIDGIRFKIVHGAPDDPDRYVYYDSMGEFLSVDEDVLIFGHTHYPVYASIEECIMLNPGSVGQPRGDDLRPAYSIYDTKTRNVRMCKCSYPIQDTIEAIKAIELNDPSDKTHHSR
jgi:putative phosphoesterase